MGVGVDVSVGDGGAVGVEDFGVVRGGDVESAS